MFKKFENSKNFTPSIFKIFLLSFENKSKNTLLDVSFFLKKKKSDLKTKKLETKV